MSSSAQHIGQSNAAARRKLIEVSIPLQKINEESAREKSIRHGHPSTLHLWWARRPLAAARAVLFAQLVDDPASRPDLYPTIEDQELERKKLFELMERLVVWENSNDEALLREAHQKILDSTDGNPPPILDPFAGGGTIPLEAQRLGLEAHASDLNPVAVLINKALIEIPPKFAGRRPVFPGAADETFQEWPRATGLAEDVRRYGQWMRDEAEKRIGHLYPKATLPDGTKATVIAWIWARTVTCPNPECRIAMPLVRSWWLGKKEGKEAYVVPVIDGKTVRFEIGHDPAMAPSSKDGTASGSHGAECVRCGAHMSAARVHSELDSGSPLPPRLIATVAKVGRGRFYLPPSPTHEEIVASALPMATEVRGRPELMPPSRGTFGGNAQGRRYGFRVFADYFSDRQIVAVSTLSDLVDEAKDRLYKDCISETNPKFSKEYSEAVSIYLAFAVSRTANKVSSVASWDSSVKMEAVRSVFARQSIEFSFDFADANPFGNSSGDFTKDIDWIANSISRLPARASGEVEQADASTRSYSGLALSTDPPYYDNMSYADTADYFYVWLRNSLRFMRKSDLSTKLTPKQDELVANRYRNDRGEEAAREFFEDGFRAVFRRARESALPDFPVTVYYAFKQQASSKDGQASTGWETLLEGMIQSGWQITATWPMRSELGNRMLSQGTNALASSIVLALRPRPEDAPRIDRRGFTAALKAELPQKLRELQQGSIAPVDLRQAAVGPGMAVFSRYSRVMNDDGSPMTVRSALQRINVILDEVLEEMVNDFDDETRYALTWFRLYAFDTGPFGDAESNATGRISLDHLERSGILTKGGGKVALIAPRDMPADYDPAGDDSISQWEVVMHLTRALATDGIPAASALMGQVPPSVDRDLCRELAGLLFKLAEDRKKTALAVDFNQLGAAWNDIARGAGTTGSQGTLL